MSPISAADVRRRFLEFFAERQHVIVPSAGLIPHHPSAPMFTNSGMMPFVPYFLGEEPPPWKPARAASVQKCVRLSGKQSDIDNIGHSLRHFTFFEMLGNFSFGDYFKAEAIPWAWELVTEGFGLDGDRLWVTVHNSDDEAAEIWMDAVGVPEERIQRFDKDNFWEMGEVGPCGPSSEIFWDYGPEFGEPGGPAANETRYREFWNNVFTQYERQPDRSLLDLPRRNIDTGLGMERLLGILQGVESIYDTDLFAPLVEASARATGRAYGVDDNHDVALRILADHARSTAFLVNDGVFPSNEDRGYVLRRLVRRAVRQAFQLGAERLVMPAIVGTTIDVMGDAYPDLVKNRDFIIGVLEREEDRFRHTLKSGLNHLESAMHDTPVVSGSVAFQLHDTYGFPIEVTKEIAAERGAVVDEEGFESAMAEQRQRARDARKGATTDLTSTEAYRAVLDEFGRTEFTGYGEYEGAGRVLAVLPAADNRIEVFLNRTPFYAEGGGQIGDTGTITTPTGTVRVVDTTYALPGLTRHLAEVVEGVLEPGQEATASLDGPRRDAIRRNHTGTHLLHWALRETLGSQVKQQSSYVGPDYLRFDINHHEALTPEQLRQVEDLVNERVLANEPVRAYETTMDQARQQGAVAFFGDKYGEVVRIVEAGDRSMELCGGTHVAALGFIGPLRVVSESSIGSGLRRIEAVTGTGTIDRSRAAEGALGRAAALLKAGPEEVPEAVERLLHRQKVLSDELAALKGAAARDRAGDLAASGVAGVVVARVDDLDNRQLQDLAVAVRDKGARIVALFGSPDGTRVAFTAALADDIPTTVAELLGPAARTVGGGIGRADRVGVAGGRDASRIDDALEQVRSSIAALGLGNQ